MKQKGKWKLIATEEEKRKLREAIQRHETWWNSLTPTEQDKHRKERQRISDEIAAKAKKRRDYQTSPEALAIYRQPITI